MLLPKGIFKNKGLILIFALAAVASLCIFASQISETQADGYCGQCNQDSDAQHYHKGFYVHTCSGGSQYPPHQWYQGIWASPTTEEFCTNTYYSGQVQNCAAH